MEILLSSTQLDLTIKRLAHQLVENQNELDNIVFVGIQPRGKLVADKMMDTISTLYPDFKLQYGVLDITFYRDDIRVELHEPKETTITQSIEGKKVILIDDVLYTGRTIRAALDALQDFGRPKKVELCVLINRSFNRELPIQPDYCGLSIDTKPQQNVVVDWQNNTVVIYS
jgi:pyrimidine operon attenuation protein/uracil phosphoribosyltransferase